MNLYNKINNKDIIAIDGGYTLFTNQFIDNSTEKGSTFSHNNLFTL